ncbi:hypothetical protein [Nisaea sp.]|uniref:hypothetical protein n=1 Tax=Nisaea sp. TaxID=2024842 RepID=UPI003298DD24
MAKTLNPIDTDEDLLDPLNPVEDVPSELEETTHAKFLAIYADASENLRFAKHQQWRAVLYFSIGAAVATGYGEWTHWEDPTLAQLLMIMVWVFSLASAGVVLSLQWWQSAEVSKIDYVTSKWGSFSSAARKRKSKLISDLQRYGMMIAMVLYLELVTIAVTRIFLLNI